MATKNQEKIYDLYDGPSKWDLMLGLFDNLSNSRNVTFGIRDRESGQREEVEVCLNSVAREDGSGYDLSNLPKPRFATLDKSVESLRKGKNFYDSKNSKS